MTSDADRYWDELVPKYRRHRRLLPMTPEEAEEAFDDAPVAPLPPDKIRSIVESVTGGEEPHWDPPHLAWGHDSDREEVEEEMLALYREQGEEDPEASDVENKLRRNLLNDEPDQDQDGLDSGEAPPG